MEVYVILLTVNRVTVLTMVHRWGRQRTTGAELVDDDGWRALAFPLTTWCGELEPQGDSSAWEGTSNQERGDYPRRVDDGRRWESRSRFGTRC